MIESAKYLEKGAIKAVIDGRQVYIPDDFANRDRRNIAEWEAAGNIIAPYVPPTEPRLVAKALVVARLDQAGLLASAMTTLQARPADLARWSVPGRDFVRADDAATIALLTAVGADPVAILAAE